MARPLRIEFSGALYHVTSRGNGRSDIYRGDYDRQRFLELVGEVRERFSWVIHAYCLMDDHYHLLLETPQGNLAKGMRQLNGVYTQAFNREHNRTGNIFQGRYKAVVVQREPYFLELARHIVLAPVKERVVKSVKDWPWSSYRATVGRGAQSANWLHVDGILSSFGRQKARAAERYRAFVADGRNLPNPLAHIRHQIYLGSDTFVKKMKSQLETNHSNGAARKKKGAAPKPLHHFSKKMPDRDSAIVAAYATGAYSMKEVGDHFGLHYSYISRIVSRAQRAGEKR